MILSTISSAFVAFLSALLFIHLCMPLAEKVGLVDVPCERKQHKGNIPLIGGISIFFGTLVSTTILGIDSTQFNFYLLSASLIVVVGLLDDLYDISVKVRLIGQTLAAAIMIFGGGVYLADFGNLLGNGVVELGMLGAFVTVLAVLGSINATNMIDGIDGLAGSVSIVTFGSVVVLSLINGQMGVAGVVFLVTVSMLPYLVCNIGIAMFRNKLIFMGDAGSTFIGLSIAWALIFCSQGENAIFRPVTALWLFAVPLLDMVAISIRRIKKGQSPLKGDREHLHHICLRLGMSSGQALLVISVLSILLAGCGIFGEVLSVEDDVMFLSFCVIFVCYYAFLAHVWRLTAFLRRSLNIR